MIGAWVMLLKLEEPVPEQEEGGAIINEGESSGISIKSMKIPAAQYEEYGISAMAETAYQLTATITPDNATNKAVNWSIRWKNSAESGGSLDGDNWGVGKTVTDYVTVTPTSDGALTANVECIVAFGEQVIVTVTSRDNTTAKATATVDYTEKLEAINVLFGGNNFLLPGTIRNFDFSVSGQPVEEWSVRYNLYTDSVYTIADEYTSTFRISFGEDISAVESAVGAEFTWAGEDITSGMPAFDKTFFDKVFVTASGAVSANAEQLNNLISALSSGVILFEVEVTSTGTYSNMTNTYGLLVRSDGISIRVESMDLDDTSILF